MTTAIKFDIRKFDDKMSINIQKVQKMVILTQNGLKKILSRKAKKSASMTDKQQQELDKKTLSTIQLHLAPHVLCEVLNKTVAINLWLALEMLFVTKSHANKIRLKGAFVHILNS